MCIFVFGSNLAGHHGAGAAREAFMHFEAQMDVGEGPTGRAYALPTKGVDIQTLPLDEIKNAVTRFIHYAQSQPQQEFFVTAIGCGLAGYTPEQIAPMFKDAPPNCTLHRRLVDVINKQ